MFTLLSKIWSGIAALPGLVFPFLVKASQPRGWTPWVKWTVHALLLLLLLIGLAFLNDWFDLEKVIEAPWPILRRMWLPLIFLLIYALAWLGWWLWELLDREEEGSAFPDIDTAWREALQALDQAGIDLRETPVFLVTGRPAAGEEALFSAAQLPLQVRHQPRRPDSPLHIWGSRDGVYVTCAGASLLGRQAALLAEEDEPPPEEVPAAEPEPAAEPVFARGGLLDWQAVPAAAPGAAPAPSPKKPLQRDTLALPREGLESAPRKTKRRPLLLKNAEEVQLFTGRLRHLCNLINQARSPFCPVNGILLLLPWSATDNDSDSFQTGRVAQHDLAVVRKALRINCPVFVLVTDLEKATGVTDIVSRLPEKMRHLRMGLGFPLVPDLEPAQLPEMMEGGVRWICGTLTPTLVCKLLRPEVSDPAQRLEAYQANYRLYLLLYEMRLRQGRLAGMLTRAMERDDHAAALLGGCYLGCTGRHPTQEQAFVTGVFPLLVDNQNFVSWTREALLEDTQFRRWSLFGYIGLAGLSVALLLMAWYFRPWRS